MPKFDEPFPRSKQGQSAASSDPIHRVRLSGDLVTRIDAWAIARIDKLGRSEAIRHLIERGLRVPKRAARSAKRDLRASEMAGHEIDRHEDADASSTEQASRKSRLLAGPEEFRETRVDRPKKI